MTTALVVVLAVVADVDAVVGAVVVGLGRGCGFLGSGSAVSVRGGVEVVVDVSEVVDAVGVRSLVSDEVVVGGGALLVVEVGDGGDCVQIRLRFPLMTRA